MAEEHCVVLASSSPSLCLDFPLPVGVSVLRPPPHLLSRLLYSNPVCFLSSAIAESQLPELETLENSMELPDWKRRKSAKINNFHPPGPGNSLPLRNFQTASWITAVDNSGNFLISLHKTRFTSQLVLLSGRFVLSVAVGGLEDFLRLTGKISGRDGDKFEAVKMKTCKPGWEQESLASEGNSSCPEIPAFFPCPAHLVCRVSRVLPAEIPHHSLFLCQIVDAFVRSDYWHDGVLSPVSENLPGLLSFEGGGHFAVHQNSGKKEKLEKKKENPLQDKQTAAQSKEIGKS